MSALDTAMEVARILAAVWLACGILVVLVLWRVAIRPMTETDEQCSRVDVELDELAARRHR